MVNSLGYIPRSAIDAPYDNSSLPFEDLPNYFKSSYTSLHSQKQHSWFLYILANVCCFPVFFLVIAILMSLVVLICISFLINDVGHLFMGSSALCLSSLEKYLLKSFAHFLNGCLFFSC